MVLDSSAVVAVLFHEPGCEGFVEQIANSSAVGIGAPTLVETTIVCSHRLGRDARGLLARFLNEAALAVTAPSKAAMPREGPRAVNAQASRPSRDVSPGDRMAW